MESRLMLRNGEQLLLAVVIPVIVLVGMVAGAGRLGLDYDHPVVDVVHPRRAGARGDVDVVHVAGDRDRLRAALRRAQAAGLLPAPPVRAAGRQGRRAAAGRGAAAAGPLAGRRWRSAGIRTPARGLLGAVLAVLLGTAAFASLGPAHGRRAARRGDPGRGQPGLPAAARRRAPSSCPRRRTAPSATSPPGCRPARSARRMRAGVPRRRPSPGATSPCCSAGRPSAPRLTARTFSWE